MKHTAAKFVLAIILLVPLLFVGSCSVISHQRESGFAQVNEGDTEQQVIGKMGAPTDRETSSGPRLIKYGAAACIAPCAQRLWFPNKLSLAGEAWAVDLDGSSKVVHTAHIVSP